MDAEAELGSDNEDNDGSLREINKNDYEEILDKRLELYDTDIKNLIDNAEVNESHDQLASKLLEDNIADDRQNLVDLVTTITSKSRRRRNAPNIAMENEDDSMILSRMRQKQLDREKQEYDLFGSEDIKKQVLKECENKNMDDDEKQRIIDHIINRKMKKALREAKNNLQIKPETVNKPYNNGIENLVENKEKENKSKTKNPHKVGLFERLGKNSVGAKLFKQRHTKK